MKILNYKNPFQCTKSSMPVLSGSNNDVKFEVMVIKSLTCMVWGRLENLSCTILKEQEQYWNK